MNTDRIVKSFRLGLPGMVKALAVGAVLTAAWVITWAISPLLMLGLTGLGLLLGLTYMDGSMQLESIERREQYEREAAERAKRWAIKE